MGVLLSGWTYRWWETRSRTSEALRVATARLGDVPFAVGDWRGQAHPVDEEQFTQAEVSGYLFRRYENRRTGRAVTILLVCGRSGPVSVHTPDICFQGAGYDLIGAPIRYTRWFQGLSQSAEFWTARFARPAGLMSARLRVFWSWSATGTWLAPNTPRLSFARYPALYKLYVLRDAGPGEDNLDEDPCVDFLRQFLPELETRLFPGSPPSSQVTPASPSGA